jgi:hypothetical protein
MSKDNKQTKGKTRLTNMIKTGKELKIFTIKSDDLKKFSQEAKKYGVLYCVLADKKNDKIDGMVDIMVRQEDASKVNRIAERFNFKKVDTAIIQQELDKEKQTNEEVKSKDEQIIDELLGEQKELDKIENNNFPSNNKSEKESLLENSLNTKNKLESDELYHNGKRSVKKELYQIEKEIQEKEMQTNMQEKEKDKHLQHKKEKNKGKHFKESKHLDTQIRGKKKAKIRERSK